MFPLKILSSFRRGKPQISGGRREIPGGSRENTGGVEKYLGRARNCGRRQENVEENVVANTFNKIKNLLD